MCEYEFVAGDIFKKEVMQIAAILNKPRSKTIRYILERMNPCLAKKHFNEKRGRSRRPKVNATGKLSAWLPDRVYNRVKQVHDQLNTYSMALIVRELISRFINGVKKYGLDGFLEKLSRMEDDLNTARANKKRIFKPQDDIPCFLNQNTYYWLSFDSDFCLREIQLL